MTAFYVLKDEARRESCIAFIKALNLGIQWSVEVKKYRKNRSRAQNRTYWMWLNTISEYNGDKPDDLHELFKARFLGYEERMVMGEQVRFIKSTADLNTTDFSEYLVKVEALAKTLGIFLPYPDDYGR